MVAQGKENSEREDLTFIERAALPPRLEDRKFSREIIMASLSVDKTELSRLISIARVPATVVDAIGPAPKPGRGRWQELAELLASATTKRPVRSIACKRSDFVRCDYR